MIAATSHVSFGVGNPSRARLVQLEAPPQLINIHSRLTYQLFARFLSFGIELNQIFPPKKTEQFINTISHTYTIHSMFLLFPSFPQALKPRLHRYNGRLRCPGPWRTATTPRPPRAARAGPAAPRGSSAARSRTAPRSATAWPRPRCGCSGGWGGVDAVGRMADPSGRGFGLFGDQNGRVER